MLHIFCFFFEYVYYVYLLYIQKYISCHPIFGNKHFIPWKVSKNFRIAFFICSFVHKISEYNTVHLKFSNMNTSYEVDPF